MKYSIFYPLYPPFQLVIALDMFCQVIVPDGNASAGYVAKKFSLNNATFTGEIPAEIDGDIASHIFPAPFLHDHICFTVKFITHGLNDLISGNAGLQLSKLSDFPIFRALCEKRIFKKALFIILEFQTQFISIGRQSR